MDEGEGDRRVLVVGIPMPLLLPFHLPQPLPLVVVALFQHSVLFFFSLLLSFIFELHLAASKRSLLYVALVNVAVVVAFTFCRWCHDVRKLQLYQHLYYLGPLSR